MTSFMLYSSPKFARSALSTGCENSLEAITRWLPTRIGSKAKPTLNMVGSRAGRSSKVISDPRLLIDMPIFMPRIPMR